MWFGIIFHESVVAFCKKRKRKKVNNLYTKNKLWYLRLAKLKETFNIKALNLDQGNDQYHYHLLLPDLIHFLSKYIPLYKYKYFCYYWSSPAVPLQPTRGFLPAQWLCKRFYTVIDLHCGNHCSRDLTINQSLWRIVILDSNSTYLVHQNELN